MKIFIWWKTYWNILIYDVSYKALIDSKPLHIRIGKIGWFIRVYNGTRYLALFGCWKYDTIYNRIRYLVSQKSGIIYVFSTIMQKLKFIHITFCL